MRLWRTALAILFLGLVGCGTPATAAAPPAVSPVPPPSWPVTAPVEQPSAIAIPALGVKDQVVSVGLNPDRTMEVPPVTEVGWYKFGPVPGEVGPAILAGHVNYNGTPGSFAHIGQLKPGDTITVTGAAGAEATFIVYAVTSFPKTEFRADLVYGDVPEPELRLVTCSGTVSNHSYSDNTVVSARLAA